MGADSADSSLLFVDTEPFLHNDLVSGLLSDVDCQVTEVTGQFSTGSSHGHFACLNFDIDCKVTKCANNSYGNSIVRFQARGRTPLYSYSRNAKVKAMH